MLMIVSVLDARLDQKHRRHACSGHSFVSYIPLSINNKAQAVIVERIQVVLIEIQY
jgi:hypothetical protein